MSVQPQQTPPGWYPQGNVQRYWDGQRWTDNVAPLQGAPVQQVVAPVVAQQARYVSGLSSGMKLVHLILTVCTLGLWGPLWWLHARLSRKKVVY